MRMYPAVIYLLKVGNENCRTRCVIISKLTKKTKTKQSTKTTTIT